MDGALLIKVKAAIYAELRETIPPSIDVMRDFKFERTAQKTIEICEQYFDNDPILGEKL